MTNPTPFVPFTDLDFSEEVFQDESVSVDGNKNEKTNKQESEKEWKPIVHLDLDFLDKLNDGVTAIKTSIETIYAPISALLEIVKKVNQFVGSIADPAKAILDKIQSLTNELIDSIGGTGAIYFMYKLPFQIGNPGTSTQGELKMSRKIDEFWKQFEDSFVVHNEDDKAFIPSFTSKEYVGGISLLFLAPSPKEILNSIKSFLSLFSIDFVTKEEIKLREVVRISSQFRFKNIFGKKSLSVSWSKFSFPHKIKIVSLIATNIKTKEPVDLTPSVNEFYNYADKKQDVIKIENISILHDHDYAMVIEVYTTLPVSEQLSRSSSNAFSDLIGSHILRPQYRGLDGDYTQLSSLETVKFRMPSERSIKTVFSKKRFYGNFGDGAWFGTDLKTLVPEIDTLKDYVRTFVNSLLDQLVQKTDAVSQIAKAIEKKVDKVTQTVQSIHNTINLILDKLKISFSGDLCQIKTIKPQLGGIKRYIKEVSNTQGIDPKMLRDSVYIAGVFIVAGGKNPLEIERVVNFINLFVDENKEKTPTVILKEDSFSETLKQLGGFDLNGVDSPYVPIVKGL